VERMKLIDAFWEDLYAFRLLTHHRYAERVTQALADSVGLLHPRSQKTFAVHCLKSLQKQEEKAQPPQRC
jgi:hypothetical protein